MSEHLHDVDLLDPNRLSDDTLVNHFFGDAGYRDSAGSAGARSAVDYSAFDLVGVRGIGLGMPVAGRIWVTPPAQTAEPYTVTVTTETGTTAKPITMRMPALEPFAITLDDLLEDNEVTPYTNFHFEVKNRFLELIGDIIETHNRKSADYGSDQDRLANLNAVVDLGITPFAGVLVRMQDKWSRIKQLHHKRTTRGEGPAVADESVIDTLRDLAVYSLLAIELLEAEQQADESQGIPAGVYVNVVKAPVASQDGPGTLDRRDPGYDDDKATIDAQRAADKFAGVLKVDGIEEYFRCIK